MRKYDKQEVERQKGGGDVDKRKEETERNEVEKEMKD